MTEYVYCTIEQLDLSKSGNYEDAQTCQHLAYLVAEAPELKQLNVNTDSVEESKQQIRIDVNYATENSHGGVDENELGMVSIVDSISGTVICQKATKKIASYHKMQIWQAGEERDLAQIELGQKLGITPVAEMAENEDEDEDEEAADDDY